MFRDTGASRTGLGAWWWQRLTALYIAAFLILGVGLLAVAPPADFAEWRGWLASGGGRVLLALFVVATGVHAYLGLRDIFMDYVPTGTVRVVALGGWTAAVAAYMAWGLLWVAGL
ncbi:MAG TPA: succinate dehydrogenase, hydrophobic membrane anchor protein [Gammaproteobacteria bacterium]|nr:succinate dehydrogenase, hydrophobic membrane anchor protein [Gammaproteobacteria bacterium]